MKESTEQLMAKAARAINAAATLMDSDHAEFAVGLAYYAMFYAAEAMLYEKELKFSKHGGVHGAFGKHFVKTGLVEKKYHRWLLNAFDHKIVGDYSVEVEFSKGEAGEIVGQSQKFLDMVRGFLAN